MNFVISSLQQDNEPLPVSHLELLPVTKAALRKDSNLRRNLL